MTLKTKKREKNASLFRRYEKDRRSRFNALLDKLASLLPNFAESNDGVQKWTKAQIVENAIKHIRSLQQSKDSTENVSSNGDSKTFKLLKKQNKRLREVLRMEFLPEMSEKEFCQLDFSQLQELIDQKKSADKENDVPNGDAINDAGDVFVVATENRSGNAADSDHNYSVIVQQEAEVEIGQEKEIVFVEDQDCNSSVQEGALIEIEPFNEQLEQPKEQVLQPPQPIIIQMAPAAAAPNFIQSIPTVIQAAPLPIRSLRAPISIVPPNKLPLPRTSTCTTGLVNVYNTPVVASQPWRLPKEKRKRRREKKSKGNESSQQAGETSAIPSSIKKPTSETAASKGAAEEATTITSQACVNTSLDSDFVRVSASASLPKAILASQDNEQEIVDLTVEDKKSSVTNKKGENDKAPAASGSRKARSSYSIAALCQMSVNIGGDPAAGVPDNLPATGVNSPGVISLNSTESPRATPTPQSPMLPTTKSSTGNNISSKAKEQSSMNTTSNPSSAPTGKKVIQELKPKSSKDEEANEVVQPTSPTKSYLTQFPVVSKSQQPQQQKKIPLMSNEVSSPSKQGLVPKLPHESSKGSNLQVISKSKETIISSSNSQSNNPAAPSSVPPMQVPSQPPNQGYQVHVQQRQTSNLDYGYQSTSHSSYMDFPRQNYNKVNSNVASMHNRSSVMPPPPAPPPPSAAAVVAPTMNQNMFAMQSDTQHQQMHGYPSLPPDQSDSFFSVNQLVSHAKTSSQFTMPKKSSKRTSSTTTSSSSSLGPRYQKQSRMEKNEPNPSKKDSGSERKSTKTQSRLSASNPRGNPSASSSRSNSKRSYTTEALLSHGNISGHDLSGNMQQPHQSQGLRTSAGGHHHHQHYHHRNDKTSSNRMPEINWNVASDSSNSHFAPFPSISPSPNLFSQDFTSFDFPASMFGDMHTNMASTNTSGSSKPQQRKDQSSSRNPGYDLNTMQPQHQQQIIHNQQQDFQHHTDQQQASGGQQQLFDANFFATNAGTLTPPTVAGLYPAQDDNYVNFSVTTTATSTRGYSSSSVASGKIRPQMLPQQQQQQPPPQQQQQQTMNDSHLNQRQMLPDQQQVGGYPSQQQLLSNNSQPPPGGSSYVNFNLSTLFPEINVPPTADKISTLLPTVPALPTRSTASTASLPPPLPPLPPSSGTSGSADFRSIPSTPEILPHSISIFGGHPTSHQMTFGSFTASTFSSSIPSSSTTNSNNFNLNE